MAEENIKTKIQTLAEKSGHPKDFPITDADFSTLAKLSPDPDTFPITDYDFEVILGQKDKSEKPILGEGIAVQGEVDKEPDNINLYEKHYIPHSEFELLRNAKAYQLLKVNNMDTSKLEGFEIDKYTAPTKLENFDDSSKKRGKSFGPNISLPFHCLT